MSPTAQTASPLPKYLQGKQSFTLDADLALECEDRARGSNLPWEKWLEEFVNESIRANLFG